MRPSAYIHTENVSSLRQLLSQETYKYLVLIVKDTIHRMKSGLRLPGTFTFSFHKKIY